MFTNTMLYIYHKFPYHLSKTGETCALASKYGEIFVKKKDEYLNIFQLPSFYTNMYLTA